MKTSFFYLVNTFSSWIHCCSFIHSFMQVVHLPLVPSISVREVAAQCPTNWTGTANESKQKFVNKSALELRQVAAQNSPVQENDKYRLYESYNSCILYRESLWERVGLFERRPYLIASETLYCYQRRGKKQTGLRLRSFSFGPGQWLSNMVIWEEKYMKLDQKLLWSRLISPHPYIAKRSGMFPKGLPRKWSPVNFF